MIKLLIVLALAWSNNSFANPEAVPIQKVVNSALKQKYNYKGHGLSFGFYSIESCLWISKEIIIFHNYCFPQKNYPAREIEIWSKKFGIIKLYEEKFPSGNIQRVLTINQFPEALSTILPNDFENLDFNTLNYISEKLYYRRNPACWSTNLDSYTGGRTANCVNTSISFFPAWAKESQDLVNSPLKWNATFSLLLSKVPTN